MVEFNIFISVSSEELFDICLLFRQEFQLSQFVTVVLSFAAEVVSHFGAAEPLKPWLARGMQMNMWNSDNGLLALGASEIAGLRGKEQA